MGLTPDPEVVQALVGREVAGKHRYRIGPLIGQGGTSSVYRGELLVRSKPVAIKVLHARFAAESEMARRFEREVATAKRIDHPNVVAVSDSGKLDDGSLFMVMELLDGKSLDKLLAKGPMAPERALSIVRQILEALAAAHKHGVVHRDVKPANVIVVERDGGEIAKLFDFGIALNDKAAIKLTQAGTAFGTPQYISPEMATGQKVDGRADLYSVAVMPFEMVTGRLPFVKDDPLDLLRAHINEPPPTPRSIAPDLPKALDALIHRTMSKKPDERPASAEAMIGEIDRLSGQLASSRANWLWVLLLLAALGLLAWQLWERYGR